MEIRFPRKFTKRIYRKTQDMEQNDEHRDTQAEVGFTPPIHPGLISYCILVCTTHEL